jgi:hypothetical protein
LGFGKQLEKDQGKFAEILTILDYFYVSEDSYLTAYMGIKWKDWEMDKNGNPVFQNGIGEKEISSKGRHLVMASVEVPQFVSKVNGSFCEEKQI